MTGTPTGGDGPTADQVSARRPPLEPGTRLVVVSGPDKGKALTLEEGIYTVGKLETCDLPLTDPLVSRQHLELQVLPVGLGIHDLESKNGSFYQGAQFSTITIGAGGSVKIGDTELLVVSPRETGQIEIWEQHRFGPLLGASVAMRRVFALLAKYAPSSAPILIRGETGTGKELVAEAIHQWSPRNAKPFRICDLGAISSTLMESELFGHLRGSFTGANSDRAGLFAEASGGTVFLDEIGELGLLDQPRLLRALDRKQYRPIGATAYLPIDARLVAATNRDLVDEIRAGRFREDLYHRLSTLLIELPPLREHREDIRLYAEHFVEQAAERLERPPPEMPAGVISALVEHDWPGNVRELKNVLERAVLLTPPGKPLDLGTLGLANAKPRSGSATQFHEAKNQLIEAWEHDYVENLLKKANGNVSVAARNGGVSRAHLHRLIDKYQVAHTKE